MEYTPSKELKEFMFQFLTDEKIRRFNDIVDQRTRHITVVLEDVYQAQNTNAVLRSCECFGVQDVHLIQNKYEFEIVQDVSLGSAKWLNIKQYKEEGDNTLACFELLKKQGYKIICASPHENEVDLNEINIDQKTAFVIGSELEGISSIAKDNCDGFMKIPMVGFTESLNLSNCSAVIFQHLTNRLRKTNINWQLTEDEKTAILIEWCFEVTGRRDLLLDYFLSKVDSNLNQAP